MLFLESKKQGAIDYNHAYVYRFSSVPDLTYTNAVVDANTAQYYVPSTAEANAALTEYREWCGKYAQPSKAELVAELSDVQHTKNILLSLVVKVSSKFEDNLNKDMYFTSSLGFKVNGDRRTKDNLQDLITFFDLQAVDGKILYRDYDNVDQQLTKEQLQTLLVEHVTNGQKLYTMKWQLQSAINVAESFDELHAIKIDFPMSDFSQQLNVAMEL